MKTKFRFEALRLHLSLKVVIVMIIMIMIQHLYSTLKSEDVEVLSLLSDPAQPGESQHSLGNTSRREAHDSTTADSKHVIVEVETGMRMS